MGICGIGFAIEGAGIDAREQSVVCDVICNRILFQKTITKVELICAQNANLRVLMRCLQFSRTFPLDVGISSPFHALSPAFSHIHQLASGLVVSPPFSLH